MAAAGATFLQRFVRDNVCTHKGMVLVPAAPAFMFINPFQFQTFVASWGLTLVLWLILWLAVPCNPNLNCTPSTKKKDGTKALLVSFLMVYGILVVVALAARVFICSSGGPPLDAYGGGVMTQLESLFTMKRLSKGPHPQAIQPAGAAAAAAGSPAAAAALAAPSLQLPTSRLLSSAPSAQAANRLLPAGLSVPTALNSFSALRSRNAGAGGSFSGLWRNLK